MSAATHAELSASDSFAAVALLSADAQIASAALRDLGMPAAFALESLRIAGLARLFGDGQMFTHEEAGSIHPLSHVARRAGAPSSRCILVTQSTHDMRRLRAAVATAHENAAGNREQKRAALYFQRS